MHSADRMKPLTQNYKQAILVILLVCINYLVQLIPFLYLFLHCRCLRMRFACTKAVQAKVRETEGGWSCINTQLTTAHRCGGPHSQSCARPQHLGENLELVQKVRTVIRARNAFAGMLTGQSWEKRHDKNQCETRLKSLDLWLLKVYKGMETSENK